LWANLPLAEARIWRKHASGGWGDGGSVTGPEDVRPDGQARSISGPQRWVGWAEEAMFLQQAVQRGGCRVVAPDVVPAGVGKGTEELLDGAQLGEQTAGGSG
jgi:hypothetical protein